MSTTIDNFTKKLHDNLEAVEDRVESLKKSIPIKKKHGEDLPEIRN